MQTSGVARSHRLARRVGSVAHAHSVEVRQRCPGAPTERQVRWEARFRYDLRAALRDCGWHRRSAMLPAGEWELSPRCSGAVPEGNGRSLVLVRALSLVLGRGEPSLRAVEWRDVVHPFRAPDRTARRRRGRGDSGCSC